jgi:hypothetical protein
MPAWYDKAQQDVVGNATIASGNTPTLQNTVAGNAINRLSNTNTNPFDQAQSSLNTIAKGAANPWLKDPTTGAITPNTDTAMGGLFDAQNKQLQTLIPQYEAPATGASIAGGNFGSLRGQTAANTAVTNAQAELFSKQMAAALQNQSTGVSAATGLGDVGQKGTATETTLGKAEQADRFTPTANLAKILSTINAPVTTTNTTQLAPVNQLGTLTKLFPSTAGKIGESVGGILNRVFGSDSTTKDPFDFSAIYPSNLPSPGNIYDYSDYTGSNDRPLAFDPDSNIPYDYNNDSSSPDYSDDYSNWYTPNDTVDSGLDYGYTPSIGEGDYGGGWANDASNWGF